MRGLLAGRDIDPAEAGSASGSLSSVQQLADAIGPAVITTIYFGALAAGPAHAMTLSLLTVIAIGALPCWTTCWLMRWCSGPSDAPRAEG